MSKAYEEPTLIKIKPQGWVSELIIETGFWGCGEATESLGVRIDDNGGGVFTHQDLHTIKNAINKHFRELKKRKPSGDQLK